MCNRMRKRLLFCWRFLCDPRRGEVKGRRAPYARSSVWYAVIALSVVLVIALVIAGVEIAHLRSQVQSLQNNVSGLNLLLLKALGQGK